MPICGLEPHLLTLQVLARHAYIYIYIYIYIGHQQAQSLMKLKNLYAQVFLISNITYLGAMKSFKMADEISRNMVTSSNENIFCVTDPLCGEFTGHRWIPLTKAGDAGLWCFLWSAPEQTVELTIDTLVIWDANAPIMTSL